jgi:hypothetical protein
MLENIKKALGGILPPVFAKSEYTENFKNSVAGLENVLNMYNNLIILNKDNNLKNLNLDKFEFLNLINKDLKLGKNNPYDVMSEIHFFINGLVKEQTKILTQVEKDLSENSVDTVTDVKSAVMFKILDDFYFFTSYLTDLALVITTEITMFMKEDYESEWLTEKKKSSIRGETYNFINLYRVYTSVNIVEEIKKLPDLQIDLKGTGNDRMIESSLTINKHKILGNFASGFTGNPIYHIRKMLVDRDMENLKLLEEKKKMLEYKILEIKTANKDGKLEDGKYTRAVKNIEDMISTLEYKIEKLK